MKPIPNTSLEPELMLQAALAAAGSAGIGCPSRLPSSWSW